MAITQAPQGIIQGNPFSKAIRRRSKLRIAIDGPSGSGKTYSALLIARGMGGKIAAIDTEEGSMPLYSHICDFDSMALKPPFSPERYISLIRAAEQNGYQILIIDSLSHAWAGTGGILDIHTQEELRQKNGFRAWREVTPKHNELVNAILGSSMHIIATMRSKQDYVQEKSDDGKTTVRKVGLAPIQRDGVEYEFTMVLDMDHATHKAVPSKTRIDIFDRKVFVPSEETGRELIRWMEEGQEAEEPVRETRQIVR